MRSIIIKILKESEDEFEWLPEPIKVKVINVGVYYPTYLEAMEYLGVTGAKEFMEKYGENWWRSDEYVEKYGGGYDEEFLIDKGVNLTVPIKGKIYYTTDLAYSNPKKTKKIYRLIDPDTNKEFIIGEEGFVVV